jgi:glycosyltransferase involved in cell wall biosynthesis
MKGRQRVVHLTSVHEAADTRIVHKECTALAESGYDVVLVAPEPRVPMPPGVRHRTVPRARNRLERLLRTVPAVFKAALAERASVYHLHDPELVPVGMLLRLRGARVFFDVHEDIVLDIGTKPWIPPSLRAPVAAVAGAVLKVVERCFSAIVPATPSIARSFTRGRTVVVRNYPRLEDLIAADGGPAFADRPLDAIYLGAITRVRGVQQMIEAIGRPSMPENARLVLAGAFEDAATREFAESLSGWRRTRAAGFLRRDQLAAELSQARAGLLVLQPFASFEESLPTKLFEYMGAGLPVVASKFLRCRDVLQQYDCGIVVDPRDAAEIAEALRTLLLNPLRSQEMGERAREAVRQRFQWKTEAQNLVGLYEAVL